MMRMIMIDCCLTISISFNFNNFNQALQCLWSVDLILHKQFIDFYSIVKSIRPKQNICNSQNFITCYFKKN